VSSSQPVFFTAELHARPAQSENAACRTPQQRSAMARRTSVLCVVAVVLSASGWSGDAVRVVQQRQALRAKEGVGRAASGHDGFASPLHPLQFAPARLLPADDALPAMVIAPDVVVNPADENDVHVAPTIIDLERPLQGERTEVSLPAEGRAAAAAAMAGLNTSTLAEMTTLQKIRALMPAANAAATSQMQEVATLAASLFKEAQEIAESSLESKLRNQVAQAKLKEDLDAAAARSLADKAEIARLRAQLADARAKNAQSLQAEAALQRQLDRALAAATTGGLAASAAAAVGDDAVDVSETVLVPTQQLGVGPANFVCC
jgi:hypothetical protein